MAFDLRYWSQISASLNNTHSVGVGGVQSDRAAPNMFSYWSPTDTRAQVAEEDYLLPVVNSLKIGDLIYVVATNGTVNLTVSDINYSHSAQFITVIASSPTGVTNPTGGTTNNLVVFADNTGQVIRDSGGGLADFFALSTHYERAKRLGLPEPMAIPGLQLYGIDSIAFSNGVGSLFVSGLQAMQFIDNDFGSDSQICTLITGELPGSSSSPSALLELQSTTGVFVPSRMSTVQIGALTAPPDGAIVYDNTLQRGKIKENGTWNTISGGVTSVTGTPGQIDSSGGDTPVLSLPDVGTPATYTYIAELITDAQGRVSSVTSGTAPVSGVLSVVGSAGRVTSSGGANPQIDLDLTTGLAGTYAYVASLTVDNYRRVTAVTAGTAPTPGNLTAKYILQEADGTLPNAQSLGDLTTGIVFNTVTSGSGVLSTAIVGVDYPSVASVVAAQTTANAAISLATLANTTAAAADAAAALASAQAATAQTTANTALGLGTAIALAAFIVQKPVVVLPFAQDLLALGTGMLKTNVTGTVPNQYGLLSKATSGVDYMNATPAVIVQTTNTSAPNGQALDLLSTGLMKNTTGTGVVSIAVPGTDYLGPAALTALAAATFITQTPSTSLTGEQALSLLTTGLMKSTTGTGVVSIASAGTDYYAPNFPTVIQDGHGTASENFSIGKNAGISWGGSTDANTAVGIRSMYQLTTGTGNSSLGVEAGGTATSATNCTWLGYLARNIANGLTNSTAVGVNAQVAVSNAVALGYQCFVGINNDSPAYALDIKTGGGGPDALIRLQSASVPSAPSGVNDGIYSVNSSKPKFTGGSAPWSGTMVLARTGGSNALCGMITLAGASPATVSSTAISAGSLIFYCHDSALANAGWLYMGNRVNGSYFEIYSTNPLDNNNASWIIINP